jgi:leader peptidase (prepilin peptidase)/N-methyltransferase
VVPLSFGAESADDRVVIVSSVVVAGGARAGVTWALVGLAVGSFLNVVIYRVPRRRSIVRPGSACPSCGMTLRARDNIPLVSWLVLGGRCRGCRASIPVRYPLVELLTAGLFAGIGLRFGVTWTAATEAALAAGLVALAFIDLDHLLLPKRVVYPTLAAVALGIVASAASAGQWHRVAVAVACGGVAWAMFFIVNFVSPRALGFGDVRLALVIGLALGWLGVDYTILAFLLASLLGTVVGVALIAAGRIGRRTPIPFGVFLAAGALLAVVAGQPVVHWYSG